MSAGAADANGDARVAALTGAAVSLGLTFEYLFLTCFGCPPRLVFLLALVAWPVGGVLRQWRRASGAPLARDLAWLAVATAAAWALPQLHAGLPPADGADAHPFWPIWVTLVPLLAPLPFFVAHGFVELALYERGAALGAGHRTYAWLLVGHAVGLVAGFALQHALGPTSVVGAAFGCAVAAAYAASGAAPRSRVPPIGAAALALAVALTALTGPSWLHRALAIHWQSQGLERDGYREVFTQWGRYGLVSLREKPGTPAGLGLLNDIVHWSYGDPAFESTLGVDGLPFVLAESELPAVVIGAGGGRQVAMAIAAGSREIRAIELEPAVIDYFTRIRPEANRGVFLHESVRALAGEGRAAVARMEPGLGLVYIADAGAARFNSLDLLIDGSFLLTREALREYVAKLAPSGLVASFTHRDVDPERRMLGHVEATFRAAGLDAWSVAASDGYVVLGTRPSQTARLRARTTELAGRLADARLDPEPHGASARATARVGTDDRPLSQLLYAMSIRDLRDRLRAIGGATCVLAALFVTVCAGVAWRARSGSATPWGRLALAGVVVGLNFALLEIYVVGLANRSSHEIFLSTLAASVGFLALAGLGGLAAHGGARRGARAIGLAGAGVTLACGASGAVGPAFAGCAAMTLATGTLFPSLMRADARHLVVLFVADALGAAIAAVLGVLGPPLWGVTFTGWLAVAGFGAALGACALFAWRAPALGTAAR